MGLSLEDLVAATGHRHALGFAVTGIRQACPDLGFAATPAAEKLATHQ